MSVSVAPFSAVTRALKQLVQSQALVSPGDEQVNLSFTAPDREYLAAIGEQPEINLYLYSCQENLERRYAEAFPVTASTDSRKTLGRSPRLVDLNYMISAWSRSQQDSVLVEQYLLSRVVQGLGKFQMFPVELLSEQGYDPGPSGVAIKMMFDQDSKRSQGEFWTALGVHPKPVLHLELTVPVDVHEPIVTPIVSDKEIILGRKDVPSDQQGPVLPYSHVLAGRISVTDNSQYHSLVVHAFSFKESQSWQTDVSDNGSYAFEQLQAGEYMLWVENTDTGLTGEREEVLLVMDGDGQVVMTEQDLEI